MIAMTWVLALSGMAGADVKIEPEAPTSCDRIRVTVTRSFTSDCGWSAAPVVELDGSAIRVSIKVTGNPICLPVVIDKELPFRIGPFPAGDYVLFLSWAENDGKPFFEGPLAIAPGACTPFIRGDSNADGSIDLGDAVTTLNYLFAGGPVACEAASDTNADGAHDLGDAVSLLNHLFADGKAPAAPYPTCGLPTDGAKPLPCEKSPCPPLPPDLIWMALADHCAQCEPCHAPPVEDVVEGLERIGIAVAEWGYGYIGVCAACGCPSGRLYAVLVSADDAERLKLDGWALWKDEVFPGRQ